ncbi:protein FAM83B-like [Nematolebias whitei]|uniref:protein FAM83B-like n=1 Tax=Nematolebias whitei TaxID=451745 RepID=UPI00189B7926|nr:protein FAM83B-like [Nematolebias whitei]
MHTDRGHLGSMESSQPGLSSADSQCSLSSDEVPEVYIEPHYKESYRLAIYALLCGGREAYEEYVQAEKIRHFLSEQEILFILEKAEKPVVEADSVNTGKVANPSTYFPLDSDEEVPDLELGWPEVDLKDADTNISLLYHPPRDNSPTIKEVVRKQIQVARQVIAIAMDVFTDVDIFMEIIGAAQRGVAVYILLDEAQIKSFLHMAHGLSVNVQDTKNICVRTVRGPQYQCQSGMKFYGSLEQKFLLVDCQTVMFGTYSYTWSFEKINLSMVLVVTGSLVSSYDVDFRSLYARSVIPSVFTNTGIGEKQENTILTSIYQQMFLRQKDLYTRHSLNHLHLKSRAMHGGAQHEGAMLSRGVSMQEKLHRSHFNDKEFLVRGHSYDEDLQKLKSLTRMKMGTRGLGVSASPERVGSLQWDGSKQTRQEQTNRLSQHHLRHQTRYGADQNLIPFNSETSLHKWKIDAYMNENGMSPDAPGDASSPEKYSQSRHRGLNEYQTQMIRRRSKEIKFKIEEMRQKRYSLQDCANLRQSRESLRSVRSERIKHMSSTKGLEMKQTVEELDPNMRNRNNLQSSEHKKAEGEMRQVFTGGQRSYSHYDIKTVADQETEQEQARCRTKSDAGLDVRRPDFKFSHLHSSGVQHSRMMESLTEIPEEKELSNTHVNNVASVHSVLAADEKEVSRKQKSLQRRVSATSQNTSDLDKALKTDTLQDSTVKQAPGTSRSQNSPNGPSETDHHKSPFSRLSPQHLSKRKTTLSAEQDQNVNTLSYEGAAVSQTKKERPIHRYESKLRKDVLRVEKSDKVPSTLDKPKSFSLNRKDNGYQMYHTQAGADNKLGRFMQRVGNLINKNK